MWMNEKIKASEVELTGLNGEDLGIVKTGEALALARKLKVDLVCTSLMSSPPPCRLVAAADAKKEAQETKAKSSDRVVKVKEIRLTPNIEDHDLDTKKQQASRILKAGNAVMLVVRVQSKEGAAAKVLLEGLVRELKEWGRAKTGIQVSGKQVAVQIDPVA
ncbi:translation initiation factor IF-3 [Paenibacillus sp. XY044]|uniref:translation initiation factor IF-3 n=1 Tax=Paenibacillus sp. XY044 TaxID=2026089 RepID=UPI000B9952DC|nr:translation initiation factor IF-3 [Paenibacillus sp. XY044]OZB91863.1 translation initiation factor IF-3 [Paenibacillus sp. XY044]